ncbi:MAG: TetR/AcrR family transcriptional regulator [Deltaproteobacteria bacterium]|jgi:AcrR family transcriptional regulator|nr:TetR/AcrR family transcriptional regulator [Deltaproteobacteria bacterium]
MGRKPVRDERRKQILEAVHTCLLEKPFHKTSIKDIAQKAGLNHGALHYYFDSKEHLLLEYIEYIWIKFRKIFEDHFNSEFEKSANDMQTFQDKMRWTLNEIALNQELAHIYTEIWAHALYNEKIMNKLKDMYRAYREQVIIEVKHFVHSEKEAKRISTMIMALWEGMSLMAIFFNQKDLNAEIDFGKFLQILTPTRSNQLEARSQ